MADSGTPQSTRPAPIHRLDIKAAYDLLTKQEQLYAHHMARASWHGARIILRQTSPEAASIFDFIISLYNQCQGDWGVLRHKMEIAKNEMDAFLDYAACFLSNVGNYYASPSRLSECKGSGDQKFVPNISSTTLEKFCGFGLSKDVKNAMMAIPPYSLGFPSKDAQSAYYPGPEILTRGEILAVSRLTEQQKILPENTRISKSISPTVDAHYTILQASTSETSRPNEPFGPRDMQVILRQGDHKDELLKISEDLCLALKYAANDSQRRTIELYIASFESGDLEIYRDALRTWVRDVGPKVEHIIGFVEPYRDPYGIRSEFEGIVAIADPNETKRLQELVKHSDRFIRRLPWCIGCTENDGKGPFEKSLFEPPDFSSIHVLAYCSSIIFPGINLPNYNDIRQEHGFKNVIIANRMSAESSDLLPSPFVAPEELETFQKHKFSAYYIWVVLHELLGHGTGKMLYQLHDGAFNFDESQPPINPLNGKPIATWYMPGQTWTGQFEDLATTVDECRAELVGACLMDDKEMLALFNFTDNTDITADDLTYNTYLQLGADGLRGLSNFNLDTKTWGQAHSRAHFATLKCLLRAGHGCVAVDFDHGRQNLVVRVDRSKIIPHGKAALMDMLLHLHMYRSTADVTACREYYDDLSSVEGEYLEWREAVISAQQPKWVFVQANTFIEDDQVRLKEYDATAEGVVQSWAERRV